MEIIKFEEFKSLEDLTCYLKDERTSRRFLETIRWKEGPECPYCKSKKVYPKGDGKRYTCGHCKNSFSVLVGTVFESTKLSLRKWFITIYLFINSKEGLSSKQLMRVIHVTQKTAWFILQKIRMLLEDGEIKPEEVEGEIVEKRGKKGKIYRVRIPKDKQKIPEVLKGYVEVGSRIYTDGIICYESLSESEKPEYEAEDPLPLCGGEELKKEKNRRVDVLWKKIKRMVCGTHHYLSKPLLHRYVNEAIYKVSQRKESTSDMFYGVLGRIERVITYEIVRPHPEKEEVKA